MAETSASQVEGPLSTAGLQQGNEPNPSVVYRETGFPGIVSLRGGLFDDCQHELRWPEAGRTFQKMSKDGAVAPALNFFRMLMMRADWKVRIPVGYEESLKTKANYLRQIKDDMDHPWSEFIADAATFHANGFAVVEKVFRERRKDNGSKYDDGFVGLKKLALRDQSSITDWEWKNNGRDLAGVWQQAYVPLNIEPNGIAFGDLSPKTVYLPRKKFLHFKNRGIKNSPWGESPLVGCWEAWKYKQAYQSNEAIAVAKDSNGLLVLGLPPRYLDPNATPEDKAVYEAYKTMIANASQNRQSGFILPNVMDDDGNKLFDLTTLTVSNSSRFDTNAIINRYTNEILVSLFSDFLSLGTSGGGSFSLKVSDQCE